jgi:transcriptional regulator with XRE-family HTH domain
MSHATPPPPIRAVFAQRLKAMRVPRGYTTARSFATALGIDENRYTRYERAEVEPDLSLLMRMCELLFVKPNDLLDQAPNPADRPGFAEAGLRPPSVTTISEVSDRSSPHTSVLKNARAWALAEAVANLDLNTASDAFARVARAAQCYGEINADPFSFVAKLGQDRRIADLGSVASSSLATLAEAVIQSAKVALLEPPGTAGSAQA